MKRTLRRRRMDLIFISTLLNRVGLIYRFLGPDSSRMQQKKKANVQPWRIRRAFPRANRNFFSRKSLLQTFLHRYIYPGKLTCLLLTFPHLGGTTNPSIPISISKTLLRAYPFPISSLHPH
ncbi:hypothetical protein AOQ84DRAFT_110334 [Glonium stellatum]|uniref:Uncharacterized protein n=1 Tax=Glonium stellatum TaxID=574774 RepID=A0A8E2JY49_9PEZI|nr:hypothetical protein AOQ84DRAFT_110334 [Glonium stellatum]